MDLKALMQKLETINTQQIVTESVETKQVITESVAAPVRSSADPVFKGSIARSLAEEFGYALDEAPNDPNATAATAANTKAMQDARAKKDAASGQVVGSGTTPAPGAAPATKPGASPAPAGQAASPAAAPAVKNPYQGADAAKFAAMSPADQAWLTKGGGQPDINDQFILARAPNKGKAVAPTAPAPAPAGQAASPAAAPAVAPGDQEDADMGAAMTANAAQSAALASGAQDDVTGVDAAVAANAANPATAPEGGQAASPAAAPAANKSMTPAITAYASRMGLLKNNKPDADAIKKFQQANGLKADGILGPNTAGAILSAQKPGSPMGGGGGGPAPAANQLAAAPGAKPAAGQPAAGLDKNRAEIDRFKSKNNMSLQANKEYVARLQAKVDAAAGGQAASPAATKSAVPGQVSNTPAAESIVTQDDAILAMIRNIRV